MPEFLKEFTELLTEEVDIDIKPISISMCPNAEFSAKTMVAVGFMFEDEE